MEKDNTMAPTWSSSDFGMEIHSAELNCGSGQLPNCFFNPNWDNSMDQSDPFESALSSMVSSPVASNGDGHGGGGDGVVLRELIGRLGSICNSGEISSRSYNNIGSTNNSCYSTPLNSPPKLNLSIMEHQMRGNLPFPGNNLPALTPFPADPGFAERAARFSSFGSRSFNGRFGLNESELPSRLGPRLESGNLSRISSNQSLKVAGSPLVVQENTDGSLQDGKFSRFSRSSTPENAELGESMEESSISEQIPGGEIGVKGQTDGHGRKRKAIPKGKAKETTPAKDAKVATESDGSNSKRSKSEEKEAGEENENGKSTAGNGKQKQSKESAKVPAEPPKDYIHVRARRGQATDSHSLAERVRREKISERMKFLQDLVPGCNKVTGKAVMLDEIINYVQSLQRQVEFLSMKLATVNPRTDLNMEALLSKDIFQSRGGSMPHNNSYPLETASQAFPYGYQQSLHMHSGIIPNGRVTSPYSPAFTHFNATGYAEAAASQASAFWEDDLHSVVQMGIGQNQPQTFHGTARMKVEL